MADSLSPPTETRACTFWICRDSFISMWGRPRACQNYGRPAACPTTREETMTRIFAACTLLATIAVFQFADAGGKGDDPKEALQALQDFIGSWNGTGTTVSSRDIWKEKADWSWRFKGKDVWLTVDMPQSKHIASAEIRYLPEKSKYQLIATEKATKK